MPVEAAILEVADEDLRSNSEAEEECTVCMPSEFTDVTDVARLVASTFEGKKVLISPEILRDLFNIPKQAHGEDAHERLRILVGAAGSNLPQAPNSDVVFTTTMLVGPSIVLPSTYSVKAVLKTKDNATELILTKPTETGHTNFSLADIKAKREKLKKQFRWNMWGNTDYGFFPR